MMAFWNELSQFGDDNFEFVELEATL